MYNTTLYGQTCNSHDTILEGIQFPDGDTNEVVKFNEIGAYASTLAGNFNGFYLPYNVYYVSSKALKELQKLSRWPRLKAFLDKEPYVYSERPITAQTKLLFPTN